MSPAMGGDNAVPFAVPARFLATGAFALALAWSALALRPGIAVGPYAAPGALAVVHVLTLGFGTLVLVGALHQLVPVLLVTRLWAPRLGAPVFGLLAAGAAGVVAGFALGIRIVPLAAGGSLVLLGLLLFGVNLVLTARGAERIDAVSRAVLLAVAFLILTALLGILVVLARVSPGLAAGLGYATPLHLGLGLAGAFLTAVAGAGHKLLSMFVLAHGVGTWRLNALTGCVSGALVVLAAHVFGGPGVAGGFLPTLATILLAAAVAFLGLDVRAILRARMRRSLEPALRTYLAGVALLVPIVGLLVAGRPAEAVAATLLGFLPLAVAGMLVKIASFLAWQHRYAGRIGTPGAGRVPMLADMARPGLAVASGVGLALGATLLVVARLAGSAPLAAAAGTAGAFGAWALAGQLVWIVRAKHEARTPAPTKGATA